MRMDDVSSYSETPSNTRRATIDDTMKMNRSNIQVPPTILKKASSTTDAMKQKPTEIDSYEMKSNYSMSTVKLEQQQSMDKEKLSTI